MSYMELIERLRNHPEIWLMTHPLFKNKMARNKLWHRLSKELKIDVPLLKKNWKYLTDQYRREYRKIKAQEDAVGTPVASGWAYFDALSFLKTGIANKSDRRLKRTSLSTESDNNDSAQDPNTASYATFQNENEGNENSTWQFNSPAKRAKRSGPSVSKADLILRKLQNLNSTILNAQSDVIKTDEDYMFFMSILPSVRTLSPIKKLQLRGKINSWVLELLSEGELDPLNNMTQYELVENEDDKQAVRDQIMAAEAI